MKIVIVGGVAGGASCAARARRLSEQAEIILLDRGEHVSFANCGMPYYIGGAIKDRDDLLVQTEEGLRRRFRLDVRTRSEVLAIDRAARELLVRSPDGKEYRESYDKLVLSPGAAPIRPPLPGADNPLVLTLRNLADTDRIKELADAGARHAVVIGGGFIGLEMAENLRGRGMEVTVVEMAPQVLPPLDAEMAEIVLDELRANGVRVVLGHRATGFAIHNTALDVALSDGSRLPTDFALLCVGVKPEIGLAKEAGLTIGQTGGIAVDESMRTTDPDIYAVGDAVEVTDFVTGRPVLIPLAGPANRQGRMVADHIFGREVAYGHTQGTAIVNVFSQIAAATGPNERTLRKLDIPCQKVYVFPSSHASYYPNAVPLAIKLLFAPDDGRVLGAQVVGSRGVDKRIDVLATAIRAGLTVYDLEELELAYAPQFGSAKDPVNIAGFVAANVLRGDMPVVYPEDVLADTSGDALVLDVRTAGEWKRGHLDRARHIPLDELRDRLAELPNNRPIHAYCGVGLRSYVATRILLQNGFRAANITGAWSALKLFQSVRSRQQT